MPGRRLLPSRHPAGALALAAILGLLGACSGVDSLGGDAPRFSDAEREDVRVQVDKALEEKRYNLAWNQERQAGADRTRLETIAVEALRDRSRHAGPMFDELRKAHSGLSADARAQVTRQTEAATRQNLWLRAVEIELLSADDPPDYRRAWAIYRQAPADQGSDLLEAITAAKQAHAESAD